MEGFEEIKSFLASDKNKDSDIITPFPFLTENAVESLRYRAEVSNLCSKMLTYLIKWEVLKVAISLQDMAKSVTKIAVRESRAQDLRNEIINSEK